MAGRSLFVFAGGLGGAFLGAGSGQNSCHADIAFVAGVLEDWLGGVLQGNHEAPGFGPCPGVIDGDFVFEVLGAGAGEAFGHVQLFAGDAHKASRLIVHGIDHERIAFPMAA